MSRRYLRHLNTTKFHIQAQNQNNQYELLNGLQELKLQGYENEKISNWLRLQRKIANLNINSFDLMQRKNLGAITLNGLENLFVGLISAVSVIKGEMTLGTLVSINLIAGQFKSNILAYINLSQSLQDSNISVDRLAEIQNQAEEDSGPIDLVQFDESIKIKSILF